MKRIVLCLVMGAALLLPARATYATPITFVAHLSGANEIPPNGSPATGSATILLDPVAQTIQINVTFAGLTALDTAAHIHCCLPFPFDPINVGVATTVPAFPGFPLGVTSGTYSSAVLSLMDPATYNPAFITLEGGIAGAEAALVAGIENGETYLNIHTQQFPGGEIRGFLVAAPAPSTLLLLGAGLAGLAFVRWRRSPRPGLRISRTQRTASHEGEGANMIRVISFATGALALLFLSAPVGATPFFFSTGNPDGKMATASRPDIPLGSEIESADDFILSSHTKITSATFVGLLPGGSPLGNITDVVVEIYRVFPKDSTNPPDGRVPTRTNSPSDVAFDSRDSAAKTLTFSSTILSASFTAANSVLNGIHPLPNVKTGGEGPVSGEEVQFTVNFTSPFDLPADHYFFVPQVLLSSGNFFWLSAANPIVGGTGPFTPDLQEWIRNSDLDPDWLRVATDIVGVAPPVFNATFSLSGDSVPEPATWLLLGLGMVALVGWQRLRRR